MSNKRVALLFANSVSCYHTLKSLHLSGFDVDVIHYQSHPIQHSKYLNRYHFIFNPFDDTQKSAEELSILLSKEKYDAVLPINDASIELALILKHEFPEIIGINHPEADRLRSKIFIWEKCAELNIPKIPGKVISTIEEYEILRNSISLPAVLKPAKSAHIIRNRIHKFGVKFARNIQDMDDFVYENIHNSSILIQDPINGKGAGYNFFSINGEVISAYSHLRLTEKDGGGVSSYRQTIPNSSFELDTISKKIIKAAGWTGIGMLEYKINNNQPYLIELNGRPWGSMALGIHCGVNPVADFIKWSITGEKPHAHSSTKIVFVRKFKEDLKEALKTKSPIKFSKWVLSLWKLVKTSEFIEDIGIDDMLFKWKALLPYYENQIKASGLDALEIKALPHLTSKQNICFVCYGNINRSAVAEYMLKTLHPELSVCSAGMINLSNRGASRNAIKFGRKYGIDMSVHRSTWIGEIEENNTIFVALDKKVFTQLSSRLKNTNSLYMLAPHEIVDPYKTDERIFEEVFTSITETLKGLNIE